MGCAGSTESWYPDDSVGAERIGDCFVLDTRSDRSRDVVCGLAPTLNLGELWTDPDFPTSAVLEGCHIVDTEGIVWLRPKDFILNARMFGDEISRYDVMQGEVGDGWFLAVLAGVADQPDMIKKLVVDSDYNSESSGYNGVVHFRLWQFPGWVDVYVDDLVPVRKVGDEHVPVIARSPQRNVMWVTLLDKAFAKLHGGYGHIHNKRDIDVRLPPCLNAGYSFSCLTGGANNKLIHTSNMEDTELTDLFSYCTTALKDGHICTTRVPDDSTNRRGLIPGQVYTVTGTTKVVSGTKTIKLFRIRSPHGHSPPHNPGQWIGAWSPGSRDWEPVDPDVQEEHAVSGGETWVCLQDFFKHFRGIRVCKLRPYISSHFHQHLDLQTILYGEWTGESAVGKDVDVRFKNPKYTMKITGEGPLLPVILEIIQHQTYEDDCKIYALRLDVYKLDASFKKYDVAVYMDMTNSRSYKGAHTVQYHYGLAPGTYLLIPNTQKPRQGQFSIRIHSVESYPCRYIKNTLGRSMLRSSKRDSTLCLPQEGNELFFPGQWKVGSNAGGTIECDTFFSNPQYVFTLADFCRLKLTLLQEHVSPHYPMSFVVFKVDDDLPLPLDATHRDEYKMVSKLPAGMSYEVTSTLSLRPGRYVVVPHTRNPRLEKTYCLIVGDIQEIELTSMLVMKSR